MAVHFPAFCPHCGLIFPATRIAAENVTNLTLQNVRQDCPRCGNWAELPDGTFDVIGETIHVLAASGLTRARLRRLNAILQAAHYGHMSDAEAADAVTNEAPELAPLLKQFGPQNDERPNDERSYVKASHPMTQASPDNARRRFDQ